VAVWWQSKWLGIRQHDVVLYKRSLPQGAANVEHIGVPVEHVLQFRSVRFGETVSHSSLFDSGLGCTSSRGLSEKYSPSRVSTQVETVEVVVMDDAVLQPASSKYKVEAQARGHQEVLKLNLIYLIFSNN
jgi:hypothetical protein